MAVVVVVGAATVVVVEVAAPHPVATKAAVPMAKTQSRFTSHAPQNLTDAPRRLVPPAHQTTQSRRLLTARKRGPLGSDYRAGVVGVHCEARLHRGGEAARPLPHDAELDYQTDGLSYSGDPGHGVTWMTPFFHGCGVQW